MPMLIKNTDEYFYEKRRDILILEMRIKKEPDDITICRKSCELSAAPQLEWFKQRGVESYHTGSPELLMGWLGHYYIDVDPVDPIAQEYSRIWENDEGISLAPDNYQMIQLSYQQWVDRGGIENHEKHLSDLEDPDYWP